MQHSYSLTAMQPFLQELTLNQAIYLQTLLPQGYSLQLSTLQGKRSRTAKKLDDSFTTEFVIPPQRKQPNTEKLQSTTNLKQTEKDNSPQQEKMYTPAKNATSASLKSEEQKKTQQAQSQKIMSTFVIRLKMHKSSWPFRMPVDPVSQAVPNYLDIVKQPMDLKTIDRKIKNHAYSAMKDFDADIRKIIANSYAFNSQDTVYYTLTKQFQNYYEQLWNQYKKNSQTFIGTQSQQKEGKEPEEYPQKNLTPIQTTPKKKSTIKSAKSDQKKQAVTSSDKNKVDTSLKVLPISKRSMHTLDFHQREKIFHKIQSLNQAGIKNLIKLLYGSALMKDWEELEIDLADLEEEKFQKLELFLSQN